MTERRAVQGGHVSGFMLVAVAAALWGTDALFRRGLALELPSTTIVVYEHLILAVLTLPLLVRGARSLRSFDVKDWVAAVAIGVGASALATLLFTAAFRYGDPTTPLLLQKLQPVVAVGAAALLLGERLLPRFGLYFSIAVTGAFLVSFPEPASVGVSAAKPALLAVGAATLWALGTVLGRHLSTKVGFSTLTALRFNLGFPAAAAFVLADEGPAGFSTVARTDLFALVLLALVPGLMALLLYYRGLARTPASLATLAELAFPAAAVSINYVVFDASLAPAQWIGLVVLTGIITFMSLKARAARSDALGVRVNGRRRVRRSRTA